MPARNNTGRAVLIAAGAVMALAIAIAGIWMQRRRGNPAKTPQGSGMAQKPSANPAPDTAQTPGIAAPPGSIQTVDAWYAGVMTRGAVRLNIRMYIGWIENDNALGCLYLYTKYNEPILLKGGIYEGLLYLREIDQPKEAFFIFNNFTGGDSSLAGEWINSSDEADRYHFTLTRE
jgi:hypothetical protein